MSDFILDITDIDVFRKEELVAESVSIRLKAGEFMYLTGRIGSGKSSLLKTLYADLPLRKGTATVVGFDLSRLSKSDIPYLRRKLGIIFQDYKLLQDRSLYENLKFAMEASGHTNVKAVKSRIDEILELIGLQNKAEKMPYQLSGGEQQLSVIGRALSNDPHLILADEPTGNLDGETADKIMNLLHRQAQNGAAVLMATHDTGIVRKFPAKLYEMPGQ